VVKQTYVTRMC